ncbi:MAG TPA: 5-dehydro-4-deoxy-D-glucuronate isomerase [Opitutaceae bacterium]|jgi:4-deoxy-L-threo-5-hexosulose-uronate ketol-isomerase|nr:5-dehydro-4-deoxy-D-glucuronate isomerase [Opitutaceae bacterium]
MDLHPTLLQDQAPRMSTEELRSQFLVQGLFQPGSTNLRYWEVDRTVIGGVSPLGSPLPLPNPPELKSAHFLERREVGVINVGGPGTVSASGLSYRMGHLDALYLGRDSSDITFASDSAAEPSLFWLQSFPAHAKHPSRLVKFADVTAEKLGSPAGANERLLSKLIHPAAFPTCQVVMGVTRISPGSVWNTMPPHTHLLRSEVYLYFAVQPANAVFHFMGGPQSTRHLVVKNLDAVLSPPWSIHSGAGTAHYSFVWGMGGENQEFSDMKKTEPSGLL